MLLRDTPLVSDYSKTSISNNNDKISVVKNERGKNVWYRNLLKPLIRETRPTYRAAFKARVVHNVGVPVPEIRGLHGLFKTNYRHYSPLYGMIFTYNNYINNLYRYGEIDKEPVVALVQELFHMLPGGEIQPTHVGRNAGAHLSKKKEEDATEVRQEIKKLEGDVVKANRHQIKRLKKELKHADGVRKIEIQSEIERRTQENNQTESTLIELRTKVVTSLDFKLARKNLKRAQEAVEMERKDRVRLAQTLAKCCSIHEFHGNENSKLPIFSTTAVLLSYMWRKYDSICAFQGYFEAMHQLGALNVSLETVLELLNLRCSDTNQTSEYSDGSGKISCDTVPLTGKSKKPKRHQDLLNTWDPTNVERATTVTTVNPGNHNRPAIIVFSYVTWAAYSQFPDCGETALRNLLNQLLYNPDTGRFDYYVLEQLKENHYPLLCDSIIDFYKRNDKPEDATSNKTAIEWIDVVSRLNSFRGWTKENTMFIKYRREKDEQNIASPLRNALKVVNALFGVDNVTGPELVRQLVEYINDLRDMDLQVDSSGVKKDGFGVLALTVAGKVRYELQSYKPVHFGFVEAQRLNSGYDSLIGADRRDYRAFRRLMKHSNRPPRSDANDEEYFQHLALASLFVPFKLRRGKVGAFFRHAPVHYTLLFANFDNEKNKQDALNWACSHEDCNVRAFLRNVETFVEPSFLPTKKGSDTKSDEDLVEPHFSSTEERDNRGECNKGFDDED